MTSVPTTQVYIFEDFQSGADSLSLEGKWIGVDSDDFSYGGTGCSFPSSEQDSFAFIFHMSELILFGDCDPGPDTPPSQILVNNRPDNTTIGQAVSDFAQLYQSPPLPTQFNGTELLNSINVSSVLECCFDALVFVPLPDVSLTNRTLIVDDSYNVIQFNGSWQVETSQTALDPTVPWYGMTFMNSTHRTTTVGDTMEFPFSGTNVVVYGGMLLSQVGSLSISYSVDDGTKTTRSFATNGTGRYPYHPNFLLVDTGALPVGDHTITLTLTSCTNQTLFIDYIFYSPGFDTLATMPNVTISPDSSPAAAGSSSPSPSPTNTPTPGSISNLTSSKTVPLGPIIGGAVGGVCLLVIICLSIFWFIRRRRLRVQNSNNEQPIRPYTFQPALVPSPPISVAPTKGGVSKKLGPAARLGVEAPTEDITPGELARRFNDLADRFERLQSSVIPPAYQSPTEHSR